MSSEQPGEVIDSDQLSAKGLALLNSFLGPEAKEIALTQAVKTCVSTKGGKDTVLTSYAWSLPSFPWVRLSEIKNAQGTFIYNLAALPAPRCSAPMIQAEMVVLRSKLFLIILELSPLSQESGTKASSLDQANHAFLLGLRNKYLKQLPPVTERMDWAEGVIDEDAFWSKPNTTESIAPGLLALEEFFAFNTVQKTHFAAPYRSEQAAERKQKLIAVAEKFNASGPSKPFLETFFGTEWTAQYLEEFFFPVSLLRSLPVA